MMTDRSMNNPDRRLWIATLAAFIVAGITGAVFRAGPAIGFTTGLALENIRHAHSHLMMFSWVTPVLFLLIGRSTARTPAEHARFRVAAWWALALGFVSFPLFLFYGYGLVQVGSAELPLAAMASGMNMLVWYVFAGLYARATRGVERDRALRMWDAAVTFLVLSSLGAWGISAVTMAGVESMRWPVALTHLFLEYFTLGWLVAAVIGWWYSVSGEAVSSVAEPGATFSSAAGAASGLMFRSAFVLFIVGAALSYLSGMPRSLVPDGLVIPARTAGAMVGISLTLFFVDSGRASGGGLAGRSGTSQSVSRWMALLLGLGLVVFSLNTDRWWADVHPTRILYVHLVLLGVVSTSLMGAIARLAWIFHASVILLLATLVTMTHLWPAGLRGVWVVDAVFAGALLPVVAAAVVLIGLMRGGPIDGQFARRP